MPGSPFESFGNQQILRRIGFDNTDYRGSAGTTVDRTRSPYEDFFRGLSTNLPHTAYALVRDNFPGILATAVENHDPDAVHQAERDWATLRSRHLVPEEQRRTHDTPPYDVDINVLEEWRPVIDLSGSLIDVALGATEPVAAMRNLDTSQALVLLHLWSSQSDRFDEVSFTSTAEEIGSRFHDGEDAPTIIKGLLDRLAQAGLVSRRQNIDDWYDQVTPLGRRVLQGIETEVLWTYDQFAGSIYAEGGRPPAYFQWLSRMIGDVDVSLLKEEDVPPYLTAHGLYRIVGKGRARTPEDQRLRADMVPQNAATRPHLQETTGLLDQLATHPGLPRPEPLTAQFDHVIRASKGPEVILFG